MFWVDEESEVVTEEVKHEQSVRQMTKRERDRQKKRAMRANPEYRCVTGWGGRKDVAKATQRAREETRCLHYMGNSFRLEGSEI